MSLVLLWPLPSKWKSTFERRSLASFFPRSFPQRGTSGVFYKDCGEKIKAAIKDPSSADKNLRYFIKKSGFQILNIPSLGARDVLVVPAKQQVGLRNVGRQLSIIGYKHGEQLHRMKEHMFFAQFTSIVVVLKDVFMAQIQLQA